MTTQKNSIAFSKSFCNLHLFQPGNRKLYAGVSANIMEILKGFAEKFQQVSVDEACLIPGPAIRDFEEAAIIALRISVNSSLIKHRFLFKTVTLTVRYEDFSTFTRSKTFPIWTSDIFVIKKTVLQLLSEFIGRKKIWLVCVGVTKLREIDNKQTLITDFVI